MEIERECKSCKDKWWGGLYDEVCPKCSSKNTKVTLSDEMFEPSEYDEYDEDSYEEDEDE